jgi:antitoxin component of MazEF toxin-antitoxin module
MRRKLKNENIRNIQQSGSGGSHYVTIPASIMRALGWKERQKVVVKQFGKNKIVIEDWKE